MKIIDYGLVTDNPNEWKIRGTHVEDHRDITSLTKTLSGTYFYRSAVLVCNGREVYNEFMTTGKRWRGCTSVIGTFPFIIKQFFIDVEAISYDDIFVDYMVKSRKDYDAFVEYYGDY